MINMETLSLYTGTRSGGGGGGGGRSHSYSRGERGRRVYKKRAGTAGWRPKGEADKRRGGGGN